MPKNPASAPKAADSPGVTIDVTGITLKVYQLNFGKQEQRRQSTGRAL
jgi:hypothetical protein